MKFRANFKFVFLLIFRRILSRMTPAGSTVSSASSSPCSSLILGRFPRSNLSNFLCPVLVCAISKRGYSRLSGPQQKTLPISSSACPSSVHLPDTTWYAHADRSFLGVRCQPILATCPAHLILRLSRYVSIWRRPVSFSTVTVVICCSLTCLHWQP